MPNEIRHVGQDTSLARLCENMGRKKGEEKMLRAEKGVQCGGEQRHRERTFSRFSRLLRDLYQESGEKVPPLDRVQSAWGH
jgi:hypothetical protein